MFFQKKKTLKFRWQSIVKKVTKKTKIVFIANPNNPTGTYLNKSRIIRTKKKIKKKYSISSG